MVQSPSWEANWFATSQEIPLISRNPKVHYRTHKRSPSVSILGQPNPHPTSRRSILILSTHLRVGLPSGLFLQKNHLYCTWIYFNIKILILVYKSRHLFLCYQLHAANFPSLQHTKICHQVILIQKKERHMSQHCLKAVNSRHIKCNLSCFRGGHVSVCGFVGFDTA